MKHRIYQIMQCLFFWGQNFSEVKIFLRSNFFLSSKFFWGQIFSEVKVFLGSKFFPRSKFFWGQIWDWVTLIFKLLKWDASSPWSFRPNTVWNSIEMMTIGKTHLTLIISNPKPGKNDDVINICPNQNRKCTIPNACQSHDLSIMTHTVWVIPIDDTNLWKQEQDSKRKFHHVTWIDPKLSLERIEGCHMWSKIRNKGWEMIHHHFCSTDMGTAKHYRHQQRHLSKKWVICRFETYIGNIKIDWKHEN